MAKTAKTANKPERLMVTKSVRISTEGGIIIFEQGKAFTDPALVGLIIEHNVPHFKIADDVPDDAVPIAHAPATHG